MKTTICHQQAACCCMLRGQDSFWFWQDSVSIQAFIEHVRLLLESSPRIQDTPTSTSWGHLGHSTLILPCLSSHTYIYLPLLSLLSSFFCPSVEQFVIEIQVHRWICHGCWLRHRCYTSSYLWRWRHEKTPSASRPPHRWGNYSNLPLWEERTGLSQMMVIAVFMHGARSLL